MPDLRQEGIIIHGHIVGSADASPLQALQGWGAQDRPSKLVMPPQRHARHRKLLMSKLLQTLACGGEAVEHAYGLPKLTNRANRLDLQQWYFVAVNSQRERAAPAPKIA